jgi:upstream activation factor subunit UAF30
MTNTTNKVENKKIISKNAAPAQKEDSVKKTSTKKDEEAVPAPVAADDEHVVEDEDEEDDGSSSKKRVPPSRDTIMQSFEDIIGSIESEIESLREGDNKTKGIKFLRTLNKKLKILKNHSGRIIKNKKTTIRKTTSNNNSGFLKPVQISKEMAKFTGWDSEQLRSRVDVTKFLCNYIKENSLQNPTDRRQILADAKLSKLLKYDVKKEGAPLTYFRVQTCLKNHFVKPEITA